MSVSSTVDADRAALDLAERIVADAAPGEMIEVSAGQSASTSVKAFGGEVESFTSAENFGVGIRVVIDQRQGFAHCGTYDEVVVREALAEARDNARFSEPDEFAGVAESDGVAAVEQDLWNQAVLDHPVDDKISLALELERRTVDADDRIRNVRTSSYGDSYGDLAVVNTAGLSSYTSATSCYLAVSALADDGDATLTGFGSDVGRDPAQLDVETTAAEAAERALQLLGATSAPSQQLTLFLEPRMAATILGIVAGTLNGEVLAKGRTPFADRLGDVIASPLLTLVDDPTDARSLGASAYDGEGLACRRNVLIDEGRLARFLHNSYTGRRAGVPSTGSAVRGARSMPGVGMQAMTAQPGDTSDADLLAGISQGLYVHSMNGIHSGVNRVSGDFSVGAEGVMIRDGQLAEPVREITLASTLQRMLLDIAAVGDTIEWLPSGTGCPALVVDGVSLAGA